MTNQELKEALLQRYPVVFRGITYSHISGIIYRASNGRIVVTAELMDKNSNSVTIAEPKHITKEELHGRSAAAAGEKPEASATGENQQSQGQSL